MAQSVVAKGVFVKLGSSTLFGQSWKRRNWVLTADGILTYFDPNGFSISSQKGKVDVSGVLVADVKTSYDDTKIKMGLHFEQGLVLSWPSQNKSMELMFERIEDASKLLVGIASLERENNRDCDGSVSSFIASNGWKATLESLDESNSKVEPCATVLSDQHQGSQDRMATATDNDSSIDVNTTSSLGRVASFCWALLCIYVSLYPTPMLLFLFSVLTGMFVELLRWGSAALDGGMKIKID